MFAFLKFACFACLCGVCLGPGMIFAQCLDHVAIGSWNTKHLGRANFSYADASALLANYDLIALQEVNTTSSGQQALQTLQQSLRDLTGENWCSIISGVPSGARERYGFLWRERAIALAARSAAQVLALCPQAEEKAFLLDKYEDKIVREPAAAYFYAKDDQRFILLASVHLVPTAKKPQLEVPWLWQTLAAEVALAEKHDRTAPAPIFLVAGDYNLSSGHPSFQIWRKNHWQAALPGQIKTSLKQNLRALNQAYDNVWWWEENPACQMSYEVRNPYNIFPQMAVRKIYRDISDHAPIGIFYRSPAGRATPLAR